MAIVCFPTEGNIGAAADTQDGRAFTELRWLQAIGHLRPRKIIIEGCQYTSSAGLVATYTAGVAIINGTRVELTTTEEITMTASETNLVFLELAYTDGLVTGAELVEHPTTVQPPDTDNSILLTELVCDAGAITANSDRRDLEGQILHGNVSGSEPSPLVECGFRPEFVQWWGLSTSGSGVLHAAGAGTREGDDDGYSWRDLDGTAGAGLTIATSHILWQNFQVQIHTTLETPCQVMYYIRGY